MKTNGPYIAINSQGQAPEWVHLIPAGIFFGRDGRGPWRLSVPENFIETTNDYQAGADIPLDYEHQSEMTEKNGRPAPAAGWIKELEAREEGIWGRVEWTSSGSAMIIEKEYRYLSPVFTYDKKTGELGRLESAGLTNRPNLELKALNNQGASMEEFLTQLAALLGLAETATQEEVFAAVQKLAEQGESANSEGEEDEKTAENDDGGEGDTPPETLPEAEAALLDAVSALVNVAEEEAGAAPDAQKAKNVMEALRAMRAMGTRLAAVEGQMARNNAQSLVGKATAAGKISPALKTWAMDYAMSDPAGFAAYVKTAPVVMAANRAERGVMGGGGSLTQEERAVCKQLGLSEADYLKSRGGKCS